MNNPYWHKLKDPRWQKKRLEIMRRDNFTCQFCGDTEETLVVHHYKYAGDPWGVDDEYLITLCQSCHDSEHALIKETKPLLLNTMTDLPADSYRAVANIIHYLKNNSEVPPNVAIDILERCFIYDIDFFKNEILKFFSEKTVNRKDNI